MLDFLSLLIHALAAPLRAQAQLEPEITRDRVPSPDLGDDEADGGSASMFTLTVQTGNVHVHVRVRVAPSHGRS
jgi:hypothetical protein